MAQQLLVGQGLLVNEASRSRSDKAHLERLLWTRDRPVAETSTWKHTTLTGGIWTRIPNKRAVLDPRLSPRGHTIMSLWPARVSCGYLSASQRGSSVSIQGRICKRFLVNSVVVGQVFLRVLQFFLVNFSSRMMNFHNLHANIALRVNGWSLGNLKKYSLHNWRASG